MSARPSDPACIFCKIVGGQIPSARILETDEALAFLDIQPLNPGHVLIIPKGHAATVAELPEEDAAAVARLLPKLCRAVRDAVAAEGYHVIINNGRAAGQTVDHVHWHIIPRHSGDDIKWPWPHGRYQEGEMDQMRTRIEQALGGS